MKILYTGLESQGKSLALAEISELLIARNRKWEKKFGFRRKIASNLKFSEKFYEKNKDYIVYWEDMRDVISLVGYDIIWDEISSDFSALKREPLTRKINRWLRQGAKQGTHIYATAQEFHDVHLDFRRRVSKCFKVVKWLGSPRSGKNLPPVNFIWGICLIRELEIHPYNELAPQTIGSIPRFLFISRFLCDIFNTNQVIVSSEEPLLQHTERKCEKPGCTFKRVTHS